jgi:hypothetical protein
MFGTPKETARISAIGVESGRNPPDTCPNLADEALYNTGPLSEQNNIFNL